VSVEEVASWPVIEVEMRRDDNGAVHGRLRLPNAPSVYTPPERIGSRAGGQAA
jgi:hypothetical protein